MYYGDQQDSLLNIMKVLETNNWRIYGYKPDMSNSQTDYFNPARWGGIATKNGYILCVDVYQKGEIGEIKYQANPKNSKWHIEKDGIIIKKGIGVYTFSDLRLYRSNKSKYYYLKNEELNYKALSLKDESFRTPWDDQYLFEEYKKCELGNREESEKSLNKLFNLVSKWDKLTKTEPTTQKELLNIIFSSTAGRWKNKKGETFNTLVLTQRVKKEDWKAFTQLLKVESIGYYNYTAKAIICDKVETGLFPTEELYPEEKTLVEPSTNFPEVEIKGHKIPSKKDFMKTLNEAKKQEEDFECYPTPKEVINVVYANSNENSSFMDVGAGNGSFFDIFNAIGDKKIDKKYAIEKSIPLIQAMDKDIILVGTDFNNQTFIDKEVDAIYCNPPYSEFEAWSVKLIKEANAKILFLLVPERAEDNAKIKKALEFRDAKIRELYQYNFRNSEFRKARAKVRLYKITFKNYSGEKADDTFEKWFNEEFNLNAKKHAFKYERDSIKSKTLSENVAENELVQGDDLVKRLVALYNAEMSQTLETMREITSLSPNAINAMGELMKESRYGTGISIDSFIEKFKFKINGLKKLYWQEIFNNLDKITSKLTEKSRASMLQTLTQNTNIDFTESNIYAILIWVIKNANSYFDTQLTEVYKDLTNQENIKKYKSNRHMTKDTWRYNQFNQEVREGLIRKYSLDYRTVHSGYTALESSWDGVTIDNGNLSKESKNFLNDILTIAKNLNFSIEETPLNKGFYAGQKTIISFKGEEENKNPLKVGEMSTDGKIEEVYHSETDKYTQYRIKGEWYHKDFIKRMPKKENIFLEVRPYKNGNLHLKFSQKFMISFNIEAARLNKWVKSPQEASEEMGIDIKDVKEFFKSSLQLDVNSNQLLLGRSS